MALPEETPRVIHNGNGTRGPFSLSVGGTPISFADGSQIVVKRYDSAGVGTLQVEGTHYELSAETALPDMSDANRPIATATLSFKLAQPVLAVDEKVLIERVSTVEQALVLNVGGGFSSPANERNLDAIIRISQELANKLERVVTINALDGNGALELPAEADRAGKILIFDDDGNPDVREVGAGIGDMLAANNLSDLANVVTARTNLGLGSAALLASSAVFQVANNLSEGNASAMRSNLGLGSLALLSVGDTVSVTATGSTTARTLADWFKGMERGTVIPPAVTGYYTDITTGGDSGDPLRMRYRLFLGDGADDAGRAVPNGTQSWLTNDLDHYFARSAQLLSISPNGGAGGVFATRTSDKYDGVTVWAAGQSVTAGQQRGYANKIYTASNSGTTGATPPTHSSGSVSDGTVTWAFTSNIYRTTMALSSAVLNDGAIDGMACWGFYLDGTRASGASTVFLNEWALKNKGADVTNDPYNIYPSGSTIALWMAGGGDNTYGGTAANPSTCAILIGKNAHTWNKGIVFEDDGLTDLGSGVRHALALGQKHRIVQFVSAGSAGSFLAFDVSANNERVGVQLANRAVNFISQDVVMGAFESIPSAGTAPDNYVALSAHAAADGYVQIRPAGTTTDVKLSLRSKGAEDVHILREDSSTNTAPHVLSVKRRSTGTPAAGIGAALTFDVETAVGNDEIGAIIEAVTTDVTSTSEDFDLVFKTMAAGDTAAERARLNNRALFVGGLAIWRTIAGSAVQIVRSSVNGAGDATETAQVTVAIPAGAMGPNGRLRITWLGSHTNSANVKTWRVRFGASGAGTGGTAFYNLAATSTAAIQHQIIIRNRNAQNSQVAYTNGAAVAFGQGAATIQTGSINTSAATEVVISNLWAGATSGESMNLEDYLIEVLYGA